MVLRSGAHYLAAVHRFLRFAGHLTVLFGLVVGLSGVRSSVCPNERELTKQSAHGTAHQLPASEHGGSDCTHDQESCDVPCLPAGACAGACATLVAAERQASTDIGTVRDVPRQQAVAFIAWFDRTPEPPPPRA